jgi:hypothetical protein
MVAAKSDGSRPKKSVHAIQTHREDGPESDFAPFALSGKVLAVDYGPGDTQKISVDRQSGEKCAGLQ